MAKEDIRQFSLDEIRQLNAEEKYVPTREDAPAHDLDEAFWESAQVVFPSVEGKQPVKIGLDREILTFFRSQGKGYQTRMNAVLRSYVEAQKKKLAAESAEKSKLSP